MSEGQVSLPIEKGRAERRSRGHWLGLLPASALTATFIVTLRVLAVAHLNTDVALQLVQLSDASKVLLGLSVVAFPTLVVAAALYVHTGFSFVLVELIKAARAHRQVDLPPRAMAFGILWPPLIALAVAVVPIDPGLFILAAVVMMTCAAIVRAAKVPVTDAENPGAERERSVETIGTTTAATATEASVEAIGSRSLSYKLRFVYIAAGLILASIGCAMLAFDDTPWLPSERVVLNSGRAISGYMVAQSVSQIVVLENSPRQIVSIPTQEVRSEILCQASQPIGGSHLIAQLFWQSNVALPRC